MFVSYGSFPPSLVTVTPSLGLALLFLCNWRVAGINSAVPPHKTHLTAF